MKIEKRTVDVYISEDGREFYDKWQYENYEKRLAEDKYMDKLNKSYEIIHCGNYELIFVKEVKDVKVFLTNYFKRQIQVRFDNYRMYEDCVDKWCYIERFCDTDEDGCPENTLKLTPVKTLLENMSKVKDFMDERSQLKMF